MSAAKRHHVPPVLLERARSMRHTPAAAEQKFWQCLRNRQLGGYTFRRQRPLPPFVADFYCAQARLIVELDGESHGERYEYDRLRTQRLERDGLRVIRFENDDVFHFLDAVLEEIRKECDRLAPAVAQQDGDARQAARYRRGEPHPPSPLAGEGGGEG